MSAQMSQTLTWLHRMERRRGGSRGVRFPRRGFVKDEYIVRYGPRESVNRLGSTCGTDSGSSGSSDGEEVVDDENFH
jgi:hypothetical protein